MDCKSEAQQGTPLPALLLDERSQRINFKYIEPGAKLQLESITELQRQKVKEALFALASSSNRSGNPKGSTTIFDEIHGAVFVYMEQEIWSTFKNSSMLKAWRGNIIHRIRKEATQRDDSMRQAARSPGKSSIPNTTEGMIARVVDSDSTASLALGLDFVLNSLLGEFHFTEFVFALVGASVGAGSEIEADKNRIGAQLFGLVRHKTCLFLLLRVT
jgi:hypothetical protein